MPEAVRVTRAGLHMALAYSLPLLAWLLGQSLLIGSDRADPAIAFQTLPEILFLLQAAAVTLCLPWLLRSRSRRGHCSGVLMLLLVPLPLYALSWLVGAAPARSIGLVLVVLPAFSLLLYALYTIGIAATRAGQPRALLLLSMQLLVLGACWNFRDDLLRLLGL